MELKELVQKVRQELADEKRYDMRTFDFHYFEHQNGKAYDVVEFYIYERLSQPNRRYLVMSYDLLTGKRLFKLMSNQEKPVSRKRVVGFERDGKSYWFSKENPKVFAKLVSGKVTKLKDFPDENEANAYKRTKFFHEIDEVEQQILAYTRENFNDLRDFVNHNI